MAKASEFAKNNVVKMLLIGDSGSGKTGSLASLALAGYKLRIIDFDKGIEPLIEAVKKNGNLSALDNIEFESLSDQMTVLAGSVIPKGVPQSIPNCMKLLDNWSPKSVKEAAELGRPSTWGRDSVIVIDSLSHLCNAAMRYTQAISGNSGKNPTQPEWGNAQRIVEQLLTLLYSDEFNTNVIVTAHVTYIQGDEKVDDDGNPAGALRGLPSALGRSLPPKIPQYFNHMLVAETRGAGAGTKRVLTTAPNGVINTKSPILTGLPRELPIESGLATYFEACLGKTSGAMVAPVENPNAVKGN